MFWQILPSSEVTVLFVMLNQVNPLFLLGIHFLMTGVKIKNTCDKSYYFQYFYTGLQYIGGPTI
jgi:hypothetical protein